MKKILISLAAVLCVSMSVKAVDDTMNPLITAMPRNTSWEYWLS